MKEVAEGLKLIEPKIDILATSPLTRAEQTAKIIAKIYGDMDVIQVPALAPGIGSTEIARWLSTQADDATLAIVAHEPDLSRLIGWLSNGQESSGVEMKKAAVCALQCPPSIEPGSCVMQWLLPPKLLRALRKL
jgi:phosphohistidine phosphatase